ncbi:hypothetical protein H112_06838 [Trichophyton rubrum D6]|uniref:Uncharacterized protein n=2 Tax=Trichophyton TaxID=5550 RepID=A0A022VVA3_TRIRU|nr:hypothetical protein H100_06862 [Trichophyton rubrum MR850]EZF39072.1 hypothetical protein H102_06822 [Trichophyton rubrum CBS 100081]EZF49638.1 hypothetical protein H103_06847 [Trichophyton rubrum CBS 288.86]EZF60349.1 hypothetical protein H104_06800 [Trichophyton rubrum CBS 289.86]EZF70947.1 hypothetical protein H105_06863 [Trichophyton soudanense CBS 452.61]EZF81536.1 hypothetical protein H110_06842 [Trichophyton rubrum MR1448]EZF92288.1 hypothetical protein H113_06894 [Trichophyton rub
MGHLAWCPKKWGSWLVSSIVRYQPAGMPCRTTMCFMVHKVNDTYNEVMYLHGPCLVWHSSDTRTRSGTPKRSPQAKTLLLASTQAKMPLVAYRIWLFSGFRACNSRSMAYDWALNIRWLVRVLRSQLYHSGQSSRNADKHRFQRRGTVWGTQSALSFYFFLTFHTFHHLLFLPPPPSFKQFSWV